jgi:osmoprotectant transport system permease protein
MRPLIALSLNLFWGLALIAQAALASDRPTITVGSKVFTESYILAEIVSQIIEQSGEADVQRRFGLGGTGIVYEAIRNNEIDIYPEYTGTITEAILKTPSITDTQAIQAAMAKQGFALSDTLGFNNTYALAVRGDFANLHHLTEISDLKTVPEIRIGFTHEFVNREDGYPKLVESYGLDLSHRRLMAHSLAYEAIAQNQIDLTDVYSTDAKIEKLGLILLKDNKKVFPSYFAVLLARKDLPAQFPKTWAALRSLEGKISEKEMMRLNAMADIEKLSFREIASRFLKDNVSSAYEQKSETTETLWRLTRQHIYLVGISLMLSILIGLPLGILAARYSFLGHAILIISAVVQTIPSLALLCFLIPAFGIGARPALVALFLYGLLPIVTGVHTGLKGLDSKLSDSARALGLSSWQRLRLIELPLASRSILAGIKTSAIIGIGTATLAALIGAGGYGAPIVTGLALNDMRTILSGAIPAALLALLVSGVFEILNRLIIPKGLR